MHWCMLTHSTGLMWPAAVKCVGRTNEIGYVLTESITIEWCYWDLFRLKLQTLCFQMDGDKDIFHTCRLSCVGQIFPFRCFGSLDLFNMHKPAEEIEPHFSSRPAPLNVTGRPDHWEIHLWRHDSISLWRMLKYSLVLIGSISANATPVSYEQSGPTADLKTRPEHL